MNVILDGQPLEFSGAQTLAGAMRAAGEAAGARGRVIVEVYVDGEAAGDAVLERPPEVEVGGEVRMVSVEPRALVRVTLMDAADALEAARKSQRASAELIQKGSVEEALKPLAEAIRTWQTVRDALEKSAGILGITIGELGPRGAMLPAATIGGAGPSPGFDAMITDLAVRLSEIKRSLAGQDWSALADVLEYEMGEQTDRWKSALATAAEGLRTVK